MCSNINMINEATIDTANATGKKDKQLRQCRSKTNNFENNLGVRQRKNLSSFLINLYSAVIDFSRQNLTSVDVRVWRLKSIPALQE